MTSFWVQHGYGKSDKIDLLIADSLVDGVILSPTDEEPGALAATVASLETVSKLMDPQTYVYSIPDGSARCHAAHGLEAVGLNWGMAASEVESLVASVIAANDNVGIDDVVAPTCLQRSFGDVWTSLSLQMARTTLAMASGGRRVYVSVVIEEGALDTWADVETWLNVITQLDAHGFYVVVARTSQSSYPAPWVASRLRNFLRLIYSLSELNGYDVVVGYGDVEGTLSVGVGARGSASGWYYSLRAFSEGKWRPSKGGRQANPRTFASGLMTPILAVGEADSAVRSSVATDVFPDPSLRQTLERDPQGWALSDSWVQHMREVADLTNRVGDTSRIDQRLNDLEEQIRLARARLGVLDAEGVPISSSYGPRLRAMADALAAFRGDESI